MTDEQQKAIYEYEAVRAKLGKVNGKSGQGLENQYNAAWKNLVRLGLKPKLRGRLNG